ncbi:hypothetical protein Ae201684_015023 [Aphanomyces euteiches]|uniref:Uncharacterized protein n=1 Tax=Aphanomyces euteiches TaxID=100861 RepID=A0A6G0WI44_9STRA|nr:hypothetical protein Ae201684_015023 [Aphanomyces euteiches]
MCIETSPAVGTSTISLCLCEFHAAKRREVHAAFRRRLEGSLPNADSERRFVPNPPRLSSSLLSHSCSLVVFAALHPLNIRSPSGRKRRSKGEINGAMGNSDDEGVALDQNERPRHSFSRERWSPGQTPALFRARSDVTKQS